MAEMESEGARPLDAAVVEALVDNDRPFLTFLERRVGNRAPSEEILLSSGLWRFRPLFYSTVTLHSTALVCWPIVSVPWNM